MAFPFVQVQVNPNNNQTFSGTSGSNSNNSADSGIFDSLMNEYSAQSNYAAKSAQGTKTNKAANETNLPQSSNSNYSRSVSQNVLNILASQININAENDNTGQLANTVFQIAGAENDEANELLAELNNINDDDAESRLLLAEIADKIIDRFSDRLSADDRNKLSLLAAGLRSSVLSNSSSSSLSQYLSNSANSANNLASNSLSSLIAGMTEAEIRAELTRSLQNALVNLNPAQNQGNNLQVENLNLHNKADNKIVINTYKQNIDEPVSNNDDEKNDNENDGDNNAETNANIEYGKLNYEYNNFAALNIMNANQGAAESQAFFTQDTAEQTGSISLDSSASQTSTSERSSSSSITASITSSTLLKSQNARSSQSTDETDDADLKNAQINSQSTDGENAPQKTASSTATGTVTNENENENNEQNGNLNNNNENSGQNFNNLNSNSRRSANNINNLNRNQNQNERDGNLNNNRLENSRQDFQSFFEGVLNNRRTASRTEAAPLNLRPDNNYNYSRAETLRDGIINVVRFTRADGNYRANMIVDPPALGRITVELTSNTSGVEASIKVINEQVRQLVQDQITQLRMTLEQQGVQVTQFAVDVQQDNTGRQQDAEQQNGRNNRRTGAINAIDGADDTSAEEFRIDLNEGLLYWVA